MLPLARQLSYHVRLLEKVEIDRASQAALGTYILHRDKEVLVVLEY